MKRTLIALAAVALVVAAATVVAPVSTAGATGLSPAETTDLTYMREEEKLARDVYRALAAKWGESAIFSRIARSEQRHMDAVKTMLDLYGVADPAAGNAAGRFTDPKLQQVYDTLVAKGSQSLAAALAVGVTIERADIADLEAALGATGNVDLDRLYGDLLRGSKNHLRAFTSSSAGAAGACTCDGSGQRAGHGGVGQHGPRSGW